MAALRTQRVTSAGGVVLRHGETGPEVLLCGRNADGLWALPKGTPEPGETIERCNGSRAATTLRKLPMARAGANASAASSTFIPA